MGFKILLHLLPYAGGVILVVVQSSNPLESYLLWCSGYHIIAWRSPYMLIYVGYYMQNMVEPAESAIQNHVLRDNEPTLSGQQALLRKDAFKRARISG